MTAKKFLALLIVSAAVMHLQADPLSEFLPDITENQRERLVSGEVISFDSTDGNHPTLHPHGTIMDETIDRTSFGAETLFVEVATLIPYPDYFSDMGLREKLIHVFNTLRSVSTQEGITYISSRKGNKPALLIEESHVTDRIGGRKELPDPVMDILPVEASMFVYQKDTSFKRNYFHYQYRNSNEELYLQVTNKTPMRVFGIIPAIKEDMMDINTSIVFTEAGMLAYSLAVVPNQKARISILGFSVHLPGAFQKRITAVQEWFVDQLDTNEHAF